MKYLIGLISLLTIMPFTYGSCTTEDGIELCFDSSTSTSTTTLNTTKAVLDINRDNISDIVSIETIASVPGTLVIYIGKECTINSDSSLCFNSANVTDISGIKGFRLADLNSDGLVDVEARTNSDSIVVYLQGPSPFTVPDTPSGEISLLGTNALTYLNYTASSTYNDGAGGYEPGGAFDGYRYQGTTKIVTDAVSRYGSGTWTALTATATNQWLDVKFETNTMVESFKIYAKSGFEDRIPKDITIQYSMDGTNYIDYESITTSLSEIQTITLTTPTPFARNFRIFMHNNHGGSLFQVDEILLKGWVEN